MRRIFLLAALFFAEHHHLIAQALITFVSGVASLTNLAHVLEGDVDGNSSPANGDGMLRTSMAVIL